MRITNCLQTILELEPELSRLDLDSSLVEEFVYLRQFLEKIDHVDLSEDDVERIETATANFLAELKTPFSRLGGEAASAARLH
jgi:hypothetical protein